MTPPPPSALLQYLALLRGPKISRAGLVLEPKTLAAAYHSFVLEAPSRAGSYLSPTRRGIPSTKGSSSRGEEHLAIALYNVGALRVTSGAVITIADYQMPFKASLRDKGVGKADLVGVDETGRIVVIELKAAGNREDYRVALVEVLAYAAAIEANAVRIASELSGRL